MAAEVFYLTVKYKELPKHYFSRYLFKKNSPSPTNFLPNKFLYTLKKKFNRERDRDVLENKLFFDLFFQQYKIPLPRNVMFCNKTIFTINGASKKVTSFGEFMTLLREAFLKIEGDSLIIKKTSWSYGGDHIYKVVRQDLDLEPDNLKPLYSEVIQSGYLFQETVKQHPELQRLNSSCLNTIRFDTFIDANGNVEIISAYLRTNIKGHHADNERSGGCEISIDLATGRLKKFGTLTLKFNGLKRLTIHPVSAVVFEDFLIPYFSAAMELTLRIAGYIPALRLVGWDVAISESGPVVVEGNSDYDLAASDLAFGGYRKNEVFCKLLKETYKM